MKRFLLLSLILFLLTGCAVQQPPQETISTEPTEPPISSLLDATSPLFEATNGAVATYRIDGVSLDALRPMGDGLLGFSCADATLYLLSGNQLEVTALARLNGAYEISDLLQVSRNGVALYNSGNHFIRFFDAALNEQHTVQLPAGAIGTPAVSPDLNTVYYCTSAGIYAMDLSTGISRLLQQNAAADQTLTGLLFDGQMLRHTFFCEDGTSETHIISTQTGQTLYSGYLAEDLIAGTEHYFLLVDSGSVTQLVFGAVNGTPGVLWPAETISNGTPLPNQNALIAIDASETECRLGYYDLTSGKHTAEVALPDIPGIYSICADANGNIWFCTYDEATRTTGLHRWDTTLSPTGDDTVYTDTYYSRTAPDIAGLAALQNKLSDFASALGIQIVLGEAAAEVQPWAGCFTTEYLVPVYEAWLSKLENALQQFPENFLSETTNSLRIVLVRSIHGRVENGYTDEVSGIQYWHGTDTYIALCITDDPAQTLYHTLGYLIDTRVLSLTGTYKNWDDLNPSGFRYDNSYVTNQTREDWKYLQENNRSFIDMFSMSFAREDRAQIFEYAMTPGNEAFFRSQTMQRKLKTICDGIRKAYGLTKDERTFLWEQYLSTK